MKKVFLCHKCSGLIFPRSGNKREQYSQETQREIGYATLVGCGCMSSYVRGFQSSITVNHAIIEQRSALLLRKKWESQKRDRDNGIFDRFWNDAVGME